MTKSPPVAGFLVALFGSLVLLVGRLPADAFIDASLQMQLGNPSGATADTNNHHNYLILRSVQAIDYNDTLGQPNWVSWDLTAGDLGDSGYCACFAADTNLPSSFYRVPSSPFSGTIYDRGHMCPSADRTETTTNNALVFLMSNIIPQAGNMNSGVWEQFESYCRTLANASNEVLITCGPSGFGTNRLSVNTNIAIASHVWKVVVVVSPGDGAATNRISATNRVIAIKVPNIDAAGTNVWQTYLTNVVAIEADTGFTFFNALPPNVAMVLRNKGDGQEPQPPLISAFSPTSGGEGTSVSITGTNLGLTTNVTFNGLSAVFSIDSNTNLTAVVPFGASSGQIVVRALGGTNGSPGSFIVGTNGPPDLTIGVTHTGNFTQGDIGDTYTITVTNVGAGPSSNTVTVVSTLPTGLTPTSISGAGWTTDLGTLTCTCTNRLLVAAAYPPIIVTVNVSATAPPSVTNSVMVSGGSDTNLDNNAASDPTTINPAGAPAATTGLATGVGSTNATLNGTINPNGQPVSVYFDYGLTTNYGSKVFVAGNLNGTTPQAVSATLTGLLAGATYHFRVTTTNVLGSATGLDQMFTTITTLVGWDMSTLTGGANSYGPSPMLPTTNAANVTVLGLARGAGVGTSGTAAAQGWGGTGWTDTSSAGAIAANRFATFSVAANSGYTLSFASISKLDYRRSDTGPTNGLLQYQLGSGAFADIATLSYSSSSDNGASLGPIDLSGIAALQSVGAGTNVTFRIVSWGGASSLGKWYLFDAAASTALDFAVRGAVAPAPAPLTPIEAWRLQWFGTTADSGPAADTAIATSDGMPNLLKYALGLCPIVATNDPVAGDISTGYLRLTVPKDPQATDVSFHVEAAGGLPGAWSSSGTTIDTNTATLLQAHANTPVASSERGFIRLRVSRP